MERDSSTEGNRRKVLKALSVGGASVASSGVFTRLAEGRDGQDSSDGQAEDGLSKNKKDELIGRYVDKGPEQQAPVFEQQTKQILRVMSTPAAETAFGQQLPKGYRERDWQPLDSPSVEEFQFRRGHNAISASVHEGTPTATLTTTKFSPDFRYTLVSEPEAGRGYVIVDPRHTPEAQTKLYPDVNSTDEAMDTMVLEQQGGDVSIQGACYQSTACKYAYLHLAYCASEPGTYTTEITCCDDSCYWGTVQSNECFSTSCSNCGYHCFGDSCQ